MVNLLTIEDSTIKSMLVDPRIMALLPCLSSAKGKLDGVAKGGKQCSRCRSEKKQIANDAMRVAKDCIKSTKGSKLAALKDILGTKQLRMVAKNAAGKPVQYTF